MAASGLGQVALLSACYWVFKGSLLPTSSIKGDGVPVIPTQIQVLYLHSERQGDPFSRYELASPCTIPPCGIIQLVWTVTCLWDRQNQLRCPCAWTQPPAPLGSVGCTWEPGFGEALQHPLPPSSLPPCVHTVCLRLQAAIRGIDLYAFGQSRIDVGQVKPSQRKIHVLS